MRDYVDEAQVRLFKLVGRKIYRELPRKIIYILTTPAGLRQQFVAWQYLRDHYDMPWSVFQRILREMRRVNGLRVEL